MWRYGVAVALLIVYAAFAALIVGGEGRAYREAHRRGAAQDLAARRNDTAPPQPSPRTPPAATPEPSPSPKPAGPPVAVAEPPGEAHLSAAKPNPRPAGPNPEPAKPRETAKPDPFWTAAPMKEVWDAAHLAPADEKRLGAALHDAVLRRNKRVGDGPYLQRAEHAADPLRAAGVRKDIEYTFTILDSDVVNAFSHPGGYIYLTRGLFEFVGDDIDEDFVLQFVIAHEMAHVELGHAIKCLQDPGLSKSGLGTIPQFFLFLFPLGYYPESMDLDADRWAFERMTGPLGRSRHEALAFLHRYNRYAEKNGFRNGRDGLEPMPDASPIDNHMRAHPAAWKRLEALRKLAAKPAR